MTIDEAIKDLLYDAQCNRADLDIEWAERNEQLVAWLEELKAYRMFDKTNFSDGYNKAIDDFANACKGNIMYKTFGLRECDIEQIAEQLKAGGKE